MTALNLLPNFPTLMDLPILSSTVLLTLLLLVGLVFFIRASSKDRTEVVQLVSTQSKEATLEQLRRYFADRAYRITAIDPNTGITFEGFVRPSGFLAVFLTLLAAVAMLCLSLVLTFLFPARAKLLPGLALLAPLAGVFYWKTSGRPETVRLTFQSSLENPPQNLVTVTAHRDELAELQRSLPLTPIAE